MRKNPYLKQEQDFRPLLMRGSFGNNFLTTSEQTRQELSLASKTPKKTYTLNDISFDMIRPPSLGTDGGISIVKNVEMCSTECTQGLFEGVMGFNYAKFKGKDASAQRPIERVTWFDCIVFCNKLSEMLGYAPYYGIIAIEKENRNYAKGDNYAKDDYPKSIMSAEVNIIGGNGFRLPTADEWLLFAKAGTDNQWSGTNIEAELKDYAWYYENSNRETHPVATKKPNEWGMYDMSGNVWEWCWDTYIFGDTSTSASRVPRGGSWYYDASALRSAVRGSNSPGFRSGDLGFRVARTIE